MLDSAIELLHEGFVTTAAILSAPLLAALAASLVMAALQTMTSMHDATIAMVPRLAVVVGTLVLVSPWILAKLVYFTTEMLRWSGSGDLGG